MDYKIFQHDYVEAQRIIGNSYMAPITDDMHPAHRILLYLRRSHFMNLRAPQTRLEKIAAFMHAPDTLTRMFDAYTEDEKQACMKAAFIHSLKEPPSSMLDLESLQIYSLIPRQQHQEVSKNMKSALKEHLNDPILQRLFAINHKCDETYDAVIPSNGFEPLNTALYWDLRSFSKTSEYMVHNGFEAWISCLRPDEKIRHFRTLNNKAKMHHIAAVSISWWSALRAYEEVSTTRARYDKAVLQALDQGILEYPNIHDQRPFGQMMLNLRTHLNDYIASARTSETKKLACNIVKKIDILFELYDVNTITYEIATYMLGTKSVTPLELPDLSFER